MKCRGCLATQGLVVALVAACGHKAPPPIPAPQAAVAGAALPGAITLPARIVADFSSGRVTLLGSLATQAEHQRVLAKAQQLYGAAHIDDQLAVDVRVFDAPWLSSDALLLPLVDNTIKDGQSAFDGRQLTLTGIIPSEIMKAQISERVSKSAPGGVTILNELQVLQE